MRMDEWIKHLKNYPPETQVVDVCWVEDDVRVIARDNYKLSLTDEEVGGVIEALSDNHDANYGINWETIEAAIDYCKGNDEDWGSPATEEDYDL